MAPSSSIAGVGEDGTVHVSLDRLIRLEHRARGLLFLARQPRSSILAGRHGSRLRGRGLDFDEIRHYVPGDDIRTIDWKVTQRTGEPQVRAYTEERDRPALFVVDQRIEMFFGSKRAMKSVVAAEIAALGTWIAFLAGDRVGAVVFDDTDIQRVRPHRSRARVEEILSAIAKKNLALHADSSARPQHAQLDHALESALRLSTHDHLVCIVSDFAGAGNRTLQLLRQLAAHNDVVAALVFDPLALSAPSSGRIVVTGGELQIEIDLGKGAVRQPLESFSSDRLRAVEDLLKRCMIPLMAVNTEEDSSEQLRRMLGRRTSRAA